MLSDKEQRVLKETRLRNLERKYSRIIQHHDLTDMATELKHEINTIKKELQ